MLLRGDIGIDAFQVPLVQFPAGRFKAGGKAARQLPDSQHPDADVVAFPAAANYFGQSSIDCFAGQEHLGQPVLRRYEPLRTDRVRHRFRVDVRNPVAVPLDRNGRVEQAQAERLVCSPRSSRNVAGTQYQKRH